MRRGVDRGDCDPCALSAALMDEFKRAGIRSIRSTNTVPHSTNAIALDDILVTALQREVVGALVPENRP